MRYGDSVGLRDAKRVIGRQWLCKRDGLHLGKCTRVSHGRVVSLGECERDRLHVEQLCGQHDGVACLDAERKCSGERHGHSERDIECTRHGLCRVFGVTIECGAYC